MERNIFIGTSGYSYPHWRKVFYPPGLPNSKWLEFYVQHFNCVELNVTFYRLPKNTTFVSWYEHSPSSFKFIIKGSRFITHIKRLKDCRQSLKLFFNRACLLKEKLSCVLWQLPPSLKCDLKTLDAFIKILRTNWPCYRYSFEFRHLSWFNSSLYRLLESNNINLCIADSPTLPPREIVTTDFLYLRFHGGKILANSRYSVKELNQWRDKIKNWLKNTETLFAFFNNDSYGFAVKNALQLTELINKKV